MSAQKAVENRTIRIKMVDGSRINGQVNLNRQSGHDRLSDLVGANGEAFLVVFNATLYEVEIENPVRISTMFVNKQHILWAQPDDTQK